MAGIVFVVALLHHSLFVKRAIVSNAYQPHMHSHYYWILTTVDILIA